MGRTDTEESDCDTVPADLDVEGVAVDNTNEAADLRRAWPGRIRAARTDEPEKRGTLFVDRRGPLDLNDQLDQEDRDKHLHGPLAKTE